MHAKYELFLKHLNKTFVEISETLIFYYDWTFCDPLVTFEHAHRQYSSVPFSVFHLDFAFRNGLIIYAFMLLFVLLSAHISWSLFYVWRYDVKCLTKSNQKLLLLHVFRDSKIL